MCRDYVAARMPPKCAAAEIQLQRPVAEVTRRGASRDRGRPKAKTEDVFSSGRENVTEQYEVCVYEVCVYDVGVRACVSQGGGGASGETRRGASRTVPPVIVMVYTHPLHPDNTAPVENKDGSPQSGDFE